MRSDDLYADDFESTMAHMALCARCQGKGIINPSSAFGLPSKCYRCAGSGQLGWKDLKPGDHVCYFYDDPAEQLRNIARFLAAGVHLGEFIFYAYDHHTPAELDAALASEGVDIVKEHARGAIRYFSKEESYLKGGTFEPQRVLDSWRDALKDALEKGFTGIRGTGEVAWALDNPNLCREFIDYELLCDHYFLTENPRFTAVCQYDRKRLPSAVVQSVELGHSLVFQD